MMKHLFLKWFLFINLVAVAAIFAGYLGVYKEIYEKDSTFISFNIMAVFVIASLVCGRTIYKFDRSKCITDNKLFNYKQHEEFGWFCSELCLSLGLLGTVIGFLQMLHGFSGLDLTIKNPQKLLAAMSYGLYSAVWTTVVGLICGVLLKIQNFALEQSLLKHEHLIEHI